MPSDPSQIDKPYHGVAPPSSADALSQAVELAYQKALSAAMAAPSSVSWPAYPSAMGVQNLKKEVSEEDEFTKFVQETRMARTRAIVGWGMFAIWCSAFLAALLCALAFDRALWSTDLPVEVRIGIISALSCMELAVLATILGSYKERITKWLNSN